LPDRYIALLRGINVGRANRVDMADLRSLVTGLGYTGVRTLLNSGNLIFDAARTDTAEVLAQVEEALQAHLHVPILVIVLSAAELAAIVAENPLRGIASDPSRLMISFHREPLDARSLEALLQQDWSPEALALGKNATYMWCPEGLIKSRLAQAARRALGDSLTTTRNWATVLKLDALANADEDQPR